MANKFDYLRKLLPYLEGKAVPAVGKAERELAKDTIIIPEVLSEGTSRVNKIDLPIEEADILSPKLNGIDLPLNETQKKYNKYKAALAATAAGGAGALALNLNAPMSEALGEKIQPAVQNEPEAQRLVQDDAKAFADLDKPSETEKALNKAISSYSKPTSDELPPPNELTTVDFGQERSLASSDALKDAYERSNDAQLGVNLGRAGAAAAAAMGGVQNQFDGNFQDQLKQAQSIPENYLKKVQFEKEDPNSPMSQGYKDLAKAMGFEIQGNASAADLERQLPQLANIYNQREAQKSRVAMAKDNREARLHEMQLRLAATRETKSATKDVKTEQLKNKFIENAQKVTAKEFEKYKKVENAFDGIEQAQGDKMGAADVSILYNFIKSQDPESVVREGEIALGQRGMSLAGRLRVATLGQFSGELLDPKFRQDVMKISRRLKDQGYTTYDQSVQVIRDTAKQRYNMSDDELTLIDPMLNRQKKEKEKATQSPLKANPSVIQIKPQDVDKMSDDEVEAELKRRGL